MRTLTRSTIVLILLVASASSNIPVWDEALSPAFYRPIEITFTVDNQALLAHNFLEVSVAEDRFRKHVVAMEPQENATEAVAQVEMIVPDGNLNLTVCALVGCSGDNVRLVCGDATIPGQIAVDRIHQITFSSDWACQTNGPALVAQTR